MRVLIVLLSLATFLLAQKMEVKDANVVISLNAKKLTLTKGAKKILQEGDSIRFVSGKGRVVIGMVQLFKKGDHYQLPLSNGFTIKGFLKEKKSSFLALFDKTKPTSRDGVAFKGKLPKIERVIHISSQKDLAILNDHFSPAPISLIIRNENGEVIEELISKNGKITFFRIDMDILKDGYSLLITNGNGDHLALYEIFRD